MRDRLISGLRLFFFSAVFAASLLALIWVEPVEETFGECELPPFYDGGVE